MGIFGIIYKGLHYVFFGQKLSKTKLSSFERQSIRNLVTNSTRLDTPRLDYLLRCFGQNTDIIWWKIGFLANG